MTSKIRSFVTGGMILGAFALMVPAQSAAAQGNSGKVKSTHTQKQKQKSKKVTRPASRRVGTGEDWRRTRVLCADGAWVLRTTYSCRDHGGLASHQGDFPPASDRARERANENSAVQRGRGSWADNERRSAIARCSDGTYWHGTTRTGACYRHGGVAVWL